MSKETDKILEKIQNIEINRNNLNSQLSILYKELQEVCIHEDYNFYAGPFEYSAIKECKLCRKNELI